MEQLPSVVRWIAVLPAAFVCASVAHVVFVFISQVVGPLFGYNSTIDELSSRTVANAVFGWLLVDVAAKVAPAYRPSVASFVAGLLVACEVALWLTGHASSGWDIYALLVASVAAVWTAASWQDHGKATASQGNRAPLNTTMPK